MTKSSIITIGVLVILIGGIWAAMAFVRSGEKPRGDNNNISQSTANTFQETLTERALTRGLHPIEGFDALMLLDIFPKLQEADFDGVQTGALHEEGVHSYANGTLTWQRTSRQPITSAEKTVLKEGYRTLLGNIAERLSMPAASAENVLAIINEVDVPADIAEHIASKSDLIIVFNPRPLSVIASPLTVRGFARGGWYFEADFQITLVDWNGRIIAESHATAQGDWMTAEFVPFEGALEFENPSTQADVSRRGTLIFQKSNPSGLPERADALEIPVLFE